MQQPDTVTHHPAFGPVHVAVAQHVRSGCLAGASYAVLQGQTLLDLRLIGQARCETGEALRTDHLFRVFSNTKLLTSIAVLQLVERGLLALDDPIDRHLPELARRQVLRPGARRLGEVEPARSAPTLRQLLSHSAGFSYGFFDPDSPIGRAYREAQVLNPATTLAQMVQALAPLPLVFHPGTGWEYSVATDVLARLVEVVSGERFDTWLQAQVLQPLGLHDTGFVVPPAQQHRLVGYYEGADVQQPLLPGLRCVDDSQPYPGAYLRTWPRLSGGGGLVSSLPDMLRLVRSLLPGGPALLQPATRALLMQDQLPATVCQGFAQTGPLPWLGHALGGGVLRRAGPLDHPAAAGEFYWGGIAGTQWFVHPGLNLAGVLMVQRVMGFVHPVVADFKRAVYQVMSP